MVVFDTGMNGSRNLDLSTTDSPADSQRNADCADSEQPPPQQTLSPPPLQQHQRSLPILCVSDSNFPQKTFLGGRSQAVLQHQLQSGSQNVTSTHRSINTSIANVSDEGFRKDMRDLAELLSKLNPMAEEFVPSSLHSQSPRSIADGTSPYPLDFSPQYDLIESSNNRNVGRRRRNNYNNGKQRMNSRTSMAQREDVIRKTVYVSDIDQQVTEEQLAALFINCGQVVDCRICGDPKSVLRFAFIEFTDEEGARAALSLSGTMLGYYPVKILPSKTAIAPVNPTYLPRSEDELEMCTRTVYCTNIDKNVSQADVKLFFETVCGEVYRLRLLGDYHHSTRIAFVEFIRAESAIAALNCSGVVLGSSPIRVSPSKTPVRPRASRQSMR